jgi:hypothetical protein
MNAKMKLLSIAMVGLCGYAGSALACPAGPDIAHGGAWTAVSTVGGTAVVTGVGGGLDGSLCRLDSAITANLGSASGFVRDDTPNAEPRYRAQFKINADLLTSQNSTQPVRVFAATTATPANAVPEVVKLTIFGNAAGTARVLGIATACASAATHICSTSFTLTPTGTNTVEIDWVKGAAGYLKVWVNNGTEATPNINQAVDNSAWGGVDSAALGLTAGSVNFRTAQLNHAVKFDRFDSRRQTFIGSP